MSALHDAIDLGLASLVPGRVAPSRTGAIESVDPSNPGLKAMFVGGVMLMGIGGYLFYWNGQQKKKIEHEPWGAFVARQKAEDCADDRAAEQRKRLAACLGPDETWRKTRMAAEHGQVHPAQLQGHPPAAGWILPSDDKDVKFLQKARRALVEKGQSTAQFDEAIRAQREGKNAVGWNLPWPREVWTSA